MNFLTGKLLEEPILEPLVQPLVHLGRQLLELGPRLVQCFERLDLVGLLDARRSAVPPAVAHFEMYHLG